MATRSTESKYSEYSNSLVDSINCSSAFLALIESSTFLFQGYYAIFKYVSLVLWVTGTLGNVMTLIVLHSRHYGPGAGRLTLTALALADLGNYVTFTFDLIA